MWFQTENLEGKGVIVVNLEFSPCPASQKDKNKQKDPLPATYPCLLQERIIIAGTERLFTLGFYFLEKEGCNCPSREQRPHPWPNLAPGLATVCPAAPQSFLKCFLLG